LRRSQQAVAGKIGSNAVKVYACSWHRTKGNAVCSNTVRRPVDDVDRSVVDWIREHVLREELIIETVGEI
jgi:hypothetical protein